MSMFKLFRSRTPIPLGTTPSRPSETSALVAIAASGAVSGVFPLIIDVTASTANPFLFSAATSASQAAILFLLLKGASRSVFGASWSYREMLRPGNVCLFWERPVLPALLGKWGSGYGFQPYGEAHKQRGKTAGQRLPHSNTRKKKQETFARAWRRDTEEAR